MTQRLSFDYNGDESFIPLNTKIEHVKTIAGSGSDEIFRHASNYAETYGGKASEWSKKVGRIDSDKYSFDIHWAQRNGEMYEPKIKTMKARKK